MKVLALVNAHALAHVSRALEVARALRRRGHDVHFAGHGTYLAVAGAAGFPTHELPYVTIEQVRIATRSRRLWTLFPEPLVQACIDAELALYRRLKPDVVLLDNRCTARTSSEHAGIRSVAILNVHMSAQRRIPFSGTGWWPAGAAGPLVRAAGRVVNAMEDWAYDRLVMGALNITRRRLGLSRLLAHEHEQGDLSLLADVPAFSPVRELAPGMGYIGPLTWHNDLPPPACLPRLRPDRPVVYLALGSDSLADVLGPLQRFHAAGLQWVVSRGGNGPAGPWPEGVFVEDFVNAEALLPRCSAVVCHGGNGTLYQALAHALPIVALPTHAEQANGARRVEALGLGRCVWPGELRRGGPALLPGLVKLLLGDPSCRMAAVAFSEHLRGWRGAEVAADAVERGRAAPRPGSPL